jgi:hypothetical protein
MRVNVYEEELTDDLTIVTAEPEPGKRFLGVRFYLKSSPALHNVATDDDRSAVTLWFGARQDAERFLTQALHTVKQS